MFKAQARALPKQKHSGARRIAQGEGFGWQRCAASADQGGAAAAGFLQEVKRQETGGDSETLRPRRRRDLTRE